MTKVKVRFECIVGQNAIIKLVDGQMKLVFFHECEMDLTGDEDDDAEQLGELQSDLLWECFDSSLEVVRAFEELDEQPGLRLVVDHTDNVSTQEVYIASPFTITNDEAWEWAEQQDIATINHIEFRNGSLCITPQWAEDTTLSKTQMWEKDFFKYFESKWS